MGFIETLTELGTGISTLVVNMFQNISGIFFTLTEGGSVSITALGYISLIGLVVGLVFTVLRWVRSLIKSR